MEKVLIFNNSNKEIGLIKRTTTYGKEFDLMCEFIRFYVSEFLSYDKVNNLAIFIEPKLVSGYPDVVFASFSPLIQEGWSESRKNLEVDDLRILAKLIRNKGISETEINDKLKNRDRNVCCSLKKLSDANVIVNDNGWFKPVMEKAFYINELISVEVKLTDISRVTKQALCNTWFASKSYALINSKVPTETTKETFKRLGLGLYSRENGFTKITESKKTNLPSSYQSLQFNEWIGNMIMSS